MTSPNVDVRTIAAGLQFPEGPIWLGDGSTLVTEIAAGALTRVSPGGAVERTRGGSIDRVDVASGAGHVVAIEWPRPGLALAFSETAS